MLIIFYDFIRSTDKIKKEKWKLAKLMVVEIKTAKTHACFVSSKTQTIWISINVFVSLIFVDLEWFG